MSDKVRLALAATNTELEGLRERYRTTASALDQQEGWMAWLLVARRFIGEPFPNQVLITAQAPEARLLLNSAQWRVHGRMVDPDADPVWLTGPGRRSGAPTPLSHYDIAQTIGPPVGILTDPPQPSAGEERAFALWQALTGLAESHGAEVVVAGDRGDQVSLDGRRIIVPPADDHARNLHLARGIAELLLEPPTLAQREAIAAAVAIEAGVPRLGEIPPGGAAQAQALQPVLSAVVGAVREAGVAVPAPVVAGRLLRRPEVVAVPPMPTLRGVAL